MKKVIYLTMIALSAGVVAFIITLARYDFYIDEQKEIVPIRIDSDKEYVKAESSIRINPEAIEKETIEKTNEKVYEKKQVQEIVQEVIAKPEKEIVFSKPYDGKIVTTFSGEDLIFSKTLKEWIIHNGVDINGKNGEVVNAICDGEILDIKYEYRYGNIIKIKNGKYIVKYACVEPFKGLKIGDKVKKGQQIATLCEDMGFELDNGAHLHLEIWKNGVEINPSSIILDL